MRLDDSGQSNSAKKDLSACQKKRVNVNSYTRVSKIVINVLLLNEREDEFLVLICMSVNVNPLKFGAYVNI